MSKAPSYHALVSGPTSKANVDTLVAAASRNIAANGAANGAAPEVTATATANSTSGGVLMTKNGRADEPKTRAHVTTLVKAATTKASTAQGASQYDSDTITQLIDFILGILDNLLGTDLTDDLVNYIMTLLASLSPDILEKIIQALLGILAKVDVPAVINDVTIYELWHGVNHPPSTSLGEKFDFRTADGSNNNIWMPTMGAAGQAYARTIPATHPLPLNILPDPEMIWNALLKKTAADRPHPNGISSLMFAYAAVIIHTLFKTNLVDRTINDTSSYLDLSPLYGENQTAQDTVRNKDGYGKLYEDVFAESRVVTLPPAASGLLIIFCRNHNWLADKIFQINERGTWKDPKSLSTVVKTGATKSALEIQDDEIFNTARLINCGWFMHIILTDYLGTILGTYKAGNQQSLNPLVAFNNLFSEPVERGVGNVVSAEFNLMYRWHATLSLRDITATENIFQTYFPGADWNTITIQAFVVGLLKVKTDPDPRKRALPAGLSRDPATGKVYDTDLAKVLQDATDNVAQSFGANSVPALFRIIEILGIEEGRSWGMCSLNEFRKFFGLKPYQSFEEWNPIAAADAKALYKEIDNLELYPGLVAEDPGSNDGISLGPTTGHCILVDAVALTRGDRHYTTDFTPAALTTFGFNDCQFPSTDNGSFGGMLGQLLFRHLPSYYPANSSYAFFPFVIPPTIKGVLANFQLDSLYSFDRPPVPTGGLAVVNSHPFVKHVLDTYESYKVTYEPAMAFLTNGYGFMLGWDDKAKHDRDKTMMRKALFDDPAIVTKWLSFFKEKTETLLASKSYSVTGYSGKFVNIVNEVINLVPVYWTSDFLTGLPVGTKDLSEQQAYTLYAVLFTFIFINSDPEYSWGLTQAAGKVDKVLLAAAEAELKAAKENPDPTPGEPESLAFCRRLLAVAPDRDLNELAYNIMSVAVGGAAIFAHATVQVINVYLDDANATERQNIIRIANLDKVGPEDQKLLEGYVREAMRQDPQAPLVNRFSVVSEHLKSAEEDVTIKPGDVVIASLYNAMHDPTVFPSPEKIDPNRSPDNYLYFGHGLHTCLGHHFVVKAMPQMLRAIFRLKNIRRAPGVTGHFRRYKSDAYGTPLNVYIDDTGMPSPWPSELIVQYDV